MSKKAIAWKSHMQTFAEEFQNLGGRGSVAEGDVGKYIAFVMKIPRSMPLGGWCRRDGGSGKLICWVNSE